MPNNLDFSIDDETIEDNFTEDVHFDHDKEVNSLDQEMSKHKFTVTKYLSFYDIERAGVVWKKLSQKEKSDALWDFGLDIKKYRYLTVLDEHVTLEGKRKKCIRIVCEERSDKAWIETGLASGDAYLKHKGDPSLTREIKRMEDCYLSSAPTN